MIACDVSPVAMFEENRAGKGQLLHGKLQMVDLLLQLEKEEGESIRKEHYQPKATRILLDVGAKPKTSRT